MGVLQGVSLEYYKEYYKEYPKEYHTVPRSITRSTTKSATRSITRSTTRNIRVYYKEYQGVSLVASEESRPNKNLVSTGGSF